MQCLYNVSFLNGKMTTDNPAPADLLVHNSLFMTGNGEKTIVRLPEKISESPVTRA